MPKERKKCIRQKIYTISDVENAVEAVRKGMSIFAASKAFKIPYGTLHSRVTGKYSIDVKRGPDPILGYNEEEELVKWIFELSKRGFPVIKEHLLDNVQNVVIKTKRNTPFTNGRPSIHWYKAFLRRHPELSENMCQNLTRARAGITEESLKEWFTEIKRFLASKKLDNIGPERIFNIDESAFLLTPKSGKVLVRKGEKSVYNVCNNEKECYTALIGGNAAGELLPTMVIYNNERIPPLVAKHFPDDFVLGKSESGWMTSETFFSYIVNHVYHWCKVNKIEFPVILYVDGHSSHLTKALSDFCTVNDIILIALFPNATDLMQPMDVALFHPLKCAYKNAVRAWRIENNGQYLTKVHFAKVLKSALLSLDIKKIFENGFQKCGLYPLTEKAIDFSRLMKSNKSTDNVQEHQLNENFNNNSSQEFMNFIESKINPDILDKFKYSDSNEWKGALEYKQLYNFWLRCTNNTMSNFSTQENHHTDNKKANKPHGNKDIVEDVNESLMQVDHYNFDLCDMEDSQNSANIINNSNNITKELDVNTDIVEIENISLIEKTDYKAEVCSKDSSYTNQIIQEVALDQDGCTVKISDIFKNQHIHGNLIIDNSITNERINENEEKDTYFISTSNDTCNVTTNKSTFESKCDIGLNNNVDNYESNTNTEEDNLYKNICEAKENTDACDKKNESSTSQSVFGVDRITGYLFYPEIKTNTKKKPNKEKLPFVATAPEWRAWHELKFKEKEDKEQKKAELKLICKEKTIIQKQIKDVIKLLKQERADLILLNIEIENEKSLQKKSILEEKRNSLKETIKNNKDLQEKLSKCKEGFIMKERKIKIEKCRPALKEINH